MSLRPWLRVASALCTEFAAVAYIASFASLYEPAMLFHSIALGIIVTLMAGIIETMLERSSPSAL